MLINALITFLPSSIVCCKYVTHNPRVTHFFLSFFLSFFLIFTFEVLFCTVHLTNDQISIYEMCLND